MQLISMKKLILSLASVFMLPLSSFADDVVTFRISGADGNVKEYVLDNISRLTFGDETFVMVFNNADPDETFRYDDVLNMCFGIGEDSSVENISNDAQDETITYDGEVIRINGTDGVCRAVIYDISGRPVIRVADGSQISTASLSSGVYILKTNNKTFKFNKR